MPSQYYFPPFNPNVTFNKWDVVRGDGVHSDDLTYYYSLKDDNLSSTVISGISIPITSYTRSEDVTTVYFSQAGQPAFYPGAIVAVKNMVNTSVNFTGMISAAGSGSISFTNPGWPDSASVGAGTIAATINPSWTTGFAFVPTYQTKGDVNNVTLTAQLGDGYSQRQPNGLNSYNQSLNFVYTSRKNKEVRAMTNFIQNAAGATPFEVLYPVSSLENQPNHRFVCPSISYTTDSFDLTSATVQLNRVFDL